MPSSLPDFGEPPLIEVALSVQFDKLDTLQIPQLGLAWQAFRNRFPEDRGAAPIRTIFRTVWSAGRGASWGAIGIALNSTHPAALVS